MDLDQYICYVALVCLFVVVFLKHSLSTLSVEEQEGERLCIKGLLFQGNRVRMRKTRTQTEVLQREYRFKKMGQGVGLRWEKTERLQMGGEGGIIESR